MYVTSHGELPRQKLSRSMGSRERLLQAALSLSAEQGFDATSTRDIARNAGLTIGMIWKLFGIKENLRAAVDAHVAEVIAQSVASAPPTSVDVLSAWLLNSGGDLPRRHELEFRYLRRAIAENSPSAGRLLAVYLEHFEALLGTLKAQGQLQENTEVRALALTLLFTGVGVLMAGPHVAEICGDETADASLAGWTSGHRRLLRDGILKKEDIA